MSDWCWLILGEAFPAGPLFLDLTPEERERQRQGARSSGYLTRETITRALDELWNPPRLLAPPGYLGTRQPFGTVPMASREPEWTVRAAGWRLVIENGAMTGIVRDELGRLFASPRPASAVSRIAAAGSGSGI